MAGLKACATGDAHGKAGLTACATGACVSPGRVPVPQPVRAARVRSEAAENRFEERQHGADAAGANHEIPQWLEFLPAGGVRGMPKPASDIVVRPCAARDRSPPIEVAVRAPVARFERRRRPPRRPKYRLP